LHYEDVQASLQVYSNARQCSALLVLTFNGPDVCIIGIGVKNLLEDEAVVVGGSNHSHATQDLYDAIAAGDYPEWTLFIQV